MENLSRFAAKDKPPASTYTVGFVLDSGNAVTESDEGNNGRLFNVQVKLEPATRCRSSTRSNPARPSLHGAGRHGFTQLMPPWQRQ